MNKQATIVSTIVQFLVAVNMALMALGITQFENVTVDMIYTIITPIAMAVAWGYGIWKNHNFTEPAREAQSLLDALKEMGKTGMTWDEYEAQNDLGDNGYSEED